MVHFGTVHLHLWWVLGRLGVEWCLVSVDCRGFKTPTQFVAKRLDICHLFYIIFKLVYALLCMYCAVNAVVHFGTVHLHLWWVQCTCEAGSGVEER